jgi:hypothetical protein
MKTYPIFGHHFQADLQLYRPIWTIEQPLPICMSLFFWDLTKEHRPLSQRGIIAVKLFRSTNYFNNYGL